MLTVYTYIPPKPENAFDLSQVPLDELAATATEILAHHKTAVIWLGYLEGWMLTPMEEVRLRKVIRTFSCSVSSRVPLSFSNAWKNEIDFIYTVTPHGDSEIDHNGGSVFTGCQTEHSHSTEFSATDGRANQDREAGITSSRGQQERSDQEEEQENSTKENDGIRS